MVDHYRATSRETYLTLEGSLNLALNLVAGEQRHFILVLTHLV